MPFELPKLPYAKDALVPHIDAQTMELHHEKHHQGYVNKLNDAIEGTDIASHSTERLLRTIRQYSTAIRNNAGGHYNHTLFWTILSPQGGGEPQGALAKALEDRFGSIDAFREVFSHAAATQFGSGWAWLYLNQQGKLDVCATPNQDNPLMEVVPEAHRGQPLLGLDVWEHAYYLHYQNRRPDYIEAFWKVINWTEVARRFEEAKS